MHDSSDQQLEQLQERLQYRFSDTSLLRQAMVHGSYLNESTEPELQSNERLEFLGDAVLGLVVAQRLYEDYPQAGEGWLTFARSQIVRNQSLGVIGRDLQLGRSLLVGSGMNNERDRNKLKTLSNALEAIIAAVWLDGGDDEVRRVTLHLLRSDLESLGEASVDPASIQDSKSLLQQLTHSRNGTSPTYAIIDESGPSHDPSFRAVVEIDGLDLAEGEGRTKRAAEMNAASRALRLLQDEPA